MPLAEKRDFSILSIRIILLNAVSRRRKGHEVKKIEKNRKEWWWMWWWLVVVVGGLTQAQTRSWTALHLRRRRRWTIVAAAAAMECLHLLEQQQQQQQQLSRRKKTHVWKIRFKREKLCVFTDRWRWVAQPSPTQYGPIRPRDLLVLVSPPAPARGVIEIWLVLAYV